MKKDKLSECVVMELRSTDLSEIDKRLAQMRTQYRPCDSCMKSFEVNTRHCPHCGFDMGRAKMGEEKERALKCQ